jgi:uncharacterized membrane protein
MAGSRLPYALFLALVLLLNAAVFYVPYAASQGDGNAQAMYAAFAPTCHQLTSRSNCIFTTQNGSYYFGDCLPSDRLSYTKANAVEVGEETGYKLPVCSRDVAIYLAMLLGALALPFIRKIESEDWPDKWLLVAACVPIAIDGGTQLIGMRESSNAMRMITGAIVGVALPFYIVPILNSLWVIAKEKIDGGKKIGKR